MTLNSFAFHWYPHTFASEIKRSDMKNYRIQLKLFAILLLAVQSFFHAGAADAPGIKFRGLTLEQALTAAKTENKPVFLHGFADWCHYCMYMKDSVYTNKEVADFYNAHFICIKLDMEKEGKAVATSLKAHTFPVLVFYDTNGEIMHRAAGRKYKQPFLDLGNEALDPKRQMRHFKKIYEDGTATPAEVQQYFRMQEMAGMDAQLMINEYLMKQPDNDFTSLNNWRIINDILKDPTMPVMHRVIANKKGLEAKYTSDSVNTKFINVYNNYLMQFVQMLDSAGYEKAKQSIMGTNGLDLAAKICAYADLNKLKMKSEWDAYMVESKKFVDRYASDDSRRLCDIARVIYERFNGEKDKLGLAEQWAERSVTLNDNYRNNYLVASIYYVTGKKDLAFKAVNHAIEIAKRTNLDYSQASALLGNMHQ
jgi:thioredoxin-related protein